ncbi:alpha/beta hydrolase [Streptomyces sp. ISID311]|uniref:alpha/beta fold hydrolase n=1 Tax=Streptomyces sp. ISID311 TaxID=2601673 RepID=UPI0011BD3151|nr:alpha/beta hydrolase [Streptomyces sp. ISID311]TXC97382.1 alpha/beta hydrolase [Streptomyces sp. ISID311]
MSASTPPLHVVERGTGPRVVLVHGGTPQGGAAAFTAQSPLARRWHLVLPDRPGHGATPAAGPHEDFDQDADLLAPLLGEGAHLVGHSYGGLVALGMAVRQPGQVRSLTLIEPPAFTFDRDNPIVAEMARVNQRLFEDPTIAPADRLRQFFSLVGIDGKVPDPLPQPLHDVAASFATLRGPWEAEIDPADLVAGAFPILVLTSGKVAGFEAIAEAISARAGAKHLVVPGTDHAVQEAGEPVNHLLEDLWLAAESAARPTQTR